MGWITPHMSCPTASARLIMVMPRPVELFSGETNKPSDCRAPIVTIRIAAAAKVTIQMLRVRGTAFVVVVIVAALYDGRSSEPARHVDNALQLGGYLARGERRPASGADSLPARNAATACATARPTLRTSSCTLVSASSASWLVAYG